MAEKKKRNEEQWASLEIKRNRDGFKFIKADYTLTRASLKLRQSKIFIDLQSSHQSKSEQLRFI
jgi:hypothetical protein